MYEELIKRLRNVSMEYGQLDHFNNVLLLEAADAMEEQQKAINDMSEKIAHWQAETVKGDCAQWLNENCSGNWISVYERLPDKGQIVVVTDGKNTWDFGMFKGPVYSISKGEYLVDKWEWKKNTIKHVKWWMPKDSALPQPPKEEK